MHYACRGCSELRIKYKLVSSNENKQRVLKEPNSVQPIVPVRNNWKEGCRVTKDWVSFPITNTSWDADFKLIVTCLLCVCFPTPFPQTSPFSLSYLGFGGVCSFLPSHPLLSYLELLPHPSIPLPPLCVTGRSVKAKINDKSIALVSGVDMLATAWRPCFVCTLLCYGNLMEQTTDNDDDKFLNECVLGFGG